MKKISIYLLSLLVTTFTACTDDFEEINTDPNSPTSIPTSYLLTNAQRGLDEVMNNDGLFYAQMWSQTQYTNGSRYQTPELTFYPYYRGGNNFGGLGDLEEIIRLNTDEATKDGVTVSGSNNNQIAVARILKAWTFHRMTDVWGAIPYSQALKGSENFSPAYDDQSSIYQNLILELNEAADQIDGGAGVSGDIIYGGDMDKWKLFAQSLKLRIGVRMSKVAPQEAATVINDAISKGVFSSNDQNALYYYLSDAANDNPYHDHFLTRTDYAISNVFVDYLKEKNDPRLNIYASPTGGSLEAYKNDASTTLEIVGMPYGVNQSEAGSITNNSISFPGAAVRSATSPGLLMTYPEVLFIRAEAASRGWTNEDAGALYEQAIIASMDFWNQQSANTDYDNIYNVSGLRGSLDVEITSDEMQNYLQQPGIAFEEGNVMQQIAEQKWVALYMQGLEAWSEWRRTGYPELSPAPDAVDGREIPRRRAYTPDEEALNKANYEDAISRQGPNEMETRLWWDVQ